MKKIVEEVTGEGLEALLGDRVLLFCMRYNYTGRLVGVNDSDIILEDGKIVFDTGSFTDKDWACAEVPKNSTIRVRTSSIESYVSLN